VGRALLGGAAGGAVEPASGPGAAAAPAPADPALPAPADSTAAEPAPKPATAPSSDSAATSSGASQPAVELEPEPEPTTPPASAAAATGALSGPAFLSTYCVKCHGPNKQKGKLRVDSLAAMLKGGAEGAALLPGSPERSSLVTRLRLPLTNDEHMPPAKEPQPSAAQVAAFASWVRAGAGAGTAASQPLPVTSPTAATPPAAIPSDSASAAATEPATTPGGVPAATAASPSAANTVSAAAAAPAATAVDPALLEALPSQVALFNDAVQPLLREKCGKCHIKDKPAGGLDVAKHAALLEGGYSGAGVVPKSRERSVLFARLILPATHDERMPPEGEPALTADEIELIGAWIDQGAPAGGATPTAKLPGGAVRALSALGVRAGPQALRAQSGGCAACSVPGAPVSRWVAAQVLALVAAAVSVIVRRRTRRRAASPAQP
jgi:hypothetical protein